MSRKTTGIAFAAAVAYAITTYMLGLGTGFAGIALVLASLVGGAVFGFFVLEGGLKSLLIPAAAFILGLLGTAAVQGLSSATPFGSGYYLFVSAAVAWFVTLLASVLLLLLPGIRRRLLASG